MHVAKTISVNLGSVTQNKKLDETLAAALPAVSWYSYYTTSFIHTSWYKKAHVWILVSERSGCMKRIKRWPRNLCHDNGTIRITEVWKNDVVLYLEHAG